VGFYRDRVLPHLVDLTCANRAMRRLREPVVSRVDGVVVELGYGSGSNVGLYPGTVERVLAIEPSEVARRIAGKRLARHDHPPTDFVGLDGEHLPLEDASVDCVLSTFTLCTIPDVSAALAEARRVLKPGGRIVFLEHGLSGDPHVARRQHRLDGLQQRIAGGCHLTRDTPELVEAAGFRLGDVARFVAGPRVWATMTSGVGVKDPG
jgi:ubiquinone/menaquinone biosynthesis C-methylase UbiE